MNPLLEFVPDRARMIQIVRDNAENLRRSLVEHPVEHQTPSLIVYARPFTPEGPAIVGPEQTELCLILGVDWNHPSQKHQAMRRLGKLFHDKRSLPVAACLVSEVWRSHRPGSEPRLDPQREEGLIISAFPANSPEGSTAFLPFTRLRGRIVPGALEFNEQQTGGSPLVSQFFAGYLIASPAFNSRN